MQLKHAPSVLLGVTVQEAIQLYALGTAHHLQGQMWFLRVFVWQVSMVLPLPLAPSAPPVRTAHRIRLSPPSAQQALIILLLVQHHLLCVSLAQQAISAWWGALCPPSVPLGRIGPLQGPNHNHSAPLVHLGIIVWEGGQLPLGALWGPIRLQWDSQTQLSVSPVEWGSTLLGWATQPA